MKCTCLAEHNAIIEQKGKIVNKQIIISLRNSTQFSLEKIEGSGGQRHGYCCCVFGPKKSVYNYR
jgi:hypothetical protein